MFREDFWEEEEKRIREEQERVKREGRRPAVPPVDSRPGTGRTKGSATVSEKKKKKKAASVSGSVSSIKTGSTSGGSIKSAKKKRKKTAEQAVAGL